MHSAAQIARESREIFMISRTKMLIIVGLAIFGMVAILYDVSEIILMGGFSDLENDNTRHNVLRIQATLFDDISAMSGVAGDWAGWDETYSFIDDADLSYVERNIVNSTFTDIRLNVILFVNSSGGIVWEKGFDVENIIPAPVPESLHKHLSVNSILLRHNSTESSIKGIILLPEGPMLLTSKPITDNKRIAPVRGSMIWGRYLDPAEIKRISGITHLYFTVYRLDDPLVPSDIQELRNSFSESNPIIVRVGQSNFNSISGYTLLKDIYGIPVLMLRVDSSRAIYEQGKTTVNYFLITFLAVSLVFGAVAISLFERLGLTRLARRESEERYLAVVEQASEGILLVDIDTKRFMEANAATNTILGYSSSELLKLALYDVIPLDREIIDRSVQSIRIDRHKSLGEQRYTRKDGSVVDVEVSANLVSYGGREVLCFVVRDITERKRSESIRLENERIAFADKAKSEFLANMSHELRTPLNSILGFTELLIMKRAGELNEKQKHYVENVITSGNFLLSLINDILDLSKIEAGKIELLIDKIALPRTIKETLTLVKEKAAKHNIVLKTELDPSLDFMEADHQRFKQILFNLLSNAIKFNKEDGGTVTITTKKEGDMAKISVSDTGIGIREEDMVKLFNKFEQLDSGITQKYGGTGLGLAISKQLVELHGGKIWAESKYGEGSTFTFLLPIQVKNNER